MFPVVAKPAVRPIYRVRGRLTGRAVLATSHPCHPTSTTFHTLPVLCGTSGQVRGLNAAGQPYRDAQFIHTTGPQPESRTGASVLGIIPPLRAIALWAALIHRVSVFEAGRMPGRHPTSTPQPRSSFNARRWKSGSPMACWAMSHAPSAPSLTCEILARPSIPFDQLR